MAANNVPIFTITPSVNSGGSFQTVVTAANTAKDGTGTVYTLYTAGSNGGMPIGIIFRAAGTNVATVARIFLNNGSTNSTAANNALIGEITLAATTLSEVAALADYRYLFPDGFRIPSGYKINVAFGTATSAGYVPTCYAADY